MNKIKFFGRIALILILCHSGGVFAQGSVAGTWQGELAISSELSLSIHFIINDDGVGNYSALIDSSGNPSINNIAASAVSVSGSHVELEFDSLSGAYSGDFTAGNTALNGEWSQLTDTFPLNLTPYVESELSAADLEHLLGDWSGSVEGGGNATDIVFTFELDDEGSLAGSLSVPAQGVSGIALADLVMVDTTFSFTVPQAQVRFEAEFTDVGMEGTWSQAGQQTPVTFTKGEYVAENNTVFNLIEADKEALLGSWNGQLGPLVIIVRFERDENGDFISLVNSPTQGSANLPVTEVTMLDGQLKVVLALGAEFNGELKGDEIVGAWSQGGMTNPLTLSKGDYVAENVTESDLSEADQEVLLGSWTGTLGSLTIVLRFEENDSGEFVSFVDSPTQGANGLAVTSVTLDDAQLKVVLAIGAEFGGEINGSEIVGAWSQGGMSNPLTVSKD